MRCILIILLLPVIVFAAPKPESVTKGNLSATDWQYIARKVATGEDKWLAVVPTLALKVNRQQANQLKDALSTALPINTKGVLTVLHELDSKTWPERRGTDIVCVLKVMKVGKKADSYYIDTRLALLDEPTGAEYLWNLEGVWEEAKRGSK